MTVDHAETNTPTPEPAEHADKPGKSKVHKFALDHQRAELFRMPPMAVSKPREDGTRGGLIIYGLDTKHGIGEHELVRADVRNPAPQYLIDSIRKQGVVTPIRARKLAKDDFENAAVVVGRDRVKSCRWLWENEGLHILVPTLLFPYNTPANEIIGIANAENFARKTESLIAQAQHLFIQLRAEGFGDGRDEEALRAVQATTGVSIQRINTLLAFRGDDKLIKLVKAQEEGKKGGLKGEVALAIATLPEEERAEEIKNALSGKVTVAQVRESVARTKKIKKAAKKGKKAEDVAVGISKPGARKILEDQQARAEKTLDPLVIKTMAVMSGESPPSSIKGMVEAMRAVGLLK
jgi:hypothetical protein